MSDELYVGYLEKSPAGPARTTRRTVALLAVVVIAVSLMTVIGQRRFARSHFEWGEPRSFSGRIDDSGLRLELARPGANATGQVTAITLVAVGKFGPYTMTADWVGRYVELEGTLIYRDGQTLIEIVDGSIRAVSADSGSRTGPIQRSIDPPAIFEDVRLVGEIIDSKCFLGVMKPGNLKPHRACAIRCISGGIPPLLVVRDDSGGARYYWLEDLSGVPLREQVLPYIAEPVAIRGTVVDYTDRTLFRVDPATIERL